MLRRSFLKTLAGSTLAMNIDNTIAGCGFRMPAEWARHERCWMSWPYKYNIWGSDVDKVQHECATIANTIARFEPVTMLTTPKQVARARRLCGPDIVIRPITQDDNWIRDTGPIFISDGQSMGCVSFNFNVWGNKYPRLYKSDITLAKRLSEEISMPVSTAGIVGEGGAIEVDGEGTLMTTLSCLLNPNRNPGLTKKQVETALKQAFGVEKIVWLQGNDIEYITDGHIDGMARFVSPGKVVVEISDDPADPEFNVLRNNLRILKSTTDAKGRKLDVITIKRPVNLDWDALGPHFAASYVNYYIANGAVIMPKFGDRHYDKQAKNVMARAYPKRKVIQLDITHLAKGGGGIHCSTQQQPVLGYS